MGCAVSSFSFATQPDDDDPVVSVCRDRKRLIKSAVERRYTLAASHCKYNQSLYAVALALRLFISRHSSCSSSKFLITFPASSPYPTVDSHHTQSRNSFLNHKENKDTTDKDNDKDNDKDKNKDSDNEDDIDMDTVCEHFYEDGVVGPTETVMTSASDDDNNISNNDSNDNGNDYGGWDFFNFNHHVDDLTVVNGDVAEKVTVKEGGGGGNNVRVNVGDAKVTEGVMVTDGVALVEEDDGRELLEALKDVEDYFLKAYECGVEFSKMLEFNNVGPLDHLDSKESSGRFVPEIMWHKSAITRSPSCRSLLSSSSRGSSPWNGIGRNDDLFDETGGMESGSHLSTLGRLYAWEKKLYDEVKAGNEMKKIFERKSSQLSAKNGRNKQEVEDQVNDLYSRILVNVKICNSISTRIEKVRDDELQPQIIELLRGLTKTWKVMLESHKTQSRIMLEVKTFECADLANDKSRHLATLQLEAEIQNWRECFSGYIASMEAYIEALSHWAYRTTASEHEVGTPPLVFTICRDWLAVTKNLPDQAVTYAMKRFAKDLRTLWAQQDLEQQQKRKVERLVAESGKRAAGFEKEERNVVKYKSLNVKNKVEVLAEKKTQLEEFTMMVETEKAKHKAYVEETRRVVLVGFQTGFASVFDSLTEFCGVCARKFNDVGQNAILGPNQVLER